jgi:hypothetical protein
VDNNVIPDFGIAATADVGCVNPGISQAVLGAKARGRLGKSGLNNRDALLPFDTGDGQLKAHPQYKSPAN